MSRDFRDYRDSLEDILDALQKAQDFCQDLSYETFSSDDKTSWATIRALEVIGEAAKNIPVSVREKFPDIPWPDVIGMRSKLIHDYFGVDLQVVWTTVQQDLPQLKAHFERLRSEIFG